MSRLLAWRRSRSRGQALVEFAIVVPVLFLMILGVFEVGRLVFYYHTINHATREGARYAIVHGENAFDGCPSGPVPFGVTACDSDASDIKDRIAESAVGLAPSGFTYGWSGDGSTFPIYWGPNDPCTSSTMPGCSTDPYNRQHNNVTVRTEYTYDPVLLSDFFGSITLRAETTLVINN
jgi:Flp pilus assembly protein TadG